MPVSDARLPACDASGDCEECIARAAGDRQGVARRCGFLRHARRNARSSAFSRMPPRRPARIGRERFANAGDSPRGGRHAGARRGSAAAPARRTRRRSAGGRCAGRRESAGQRVVRYATLARKWTGSPYLPGMITGRDGRDTPRDPGGPVTARAARPRTARHCVRHTGRVSSRRCRPPHYRAGSFAYFGRRKPGNLTAETCPRRNKHGNKAGICAIVVHVGQVLWRRQTRLVTEGGRT